MKNPISLLVPGACVLALWFAAAVLMPALASAESPRNEMSLKEAAEFLGTTFEEVQHLVNTRQISARRVRGHWRISRNSLELFLSYLKSLGRMIPPPQPRELTAEESRKIVGGESERPTFGTELKKDKDEEDILIEYLSLRAQGVVLQKGQFIVESSFSYIMDDSNFRFIAAGPLVIDQTTENRAFRYDLILRYGLLNNLQVSLNLPYVAARREISQIDLTTPAVASQDTSNDGIGDIGVGLRYHLLKEKDHGFDLMPFVEGLIPTDFEPDTIFVSNDPTISLGQFAASAGFTIARPEDPGLLFMTLGVTHAFKKDVSGLGTLHSFTTVNYSGGFSIALNDNFAPFFSISGTVPVGDRDITAGGVTISQNADLVSLRLGADYRFSRSLYIEPSVTFGLTEDSQDVFFNLSLPYQFN